MNHLTDTEILLLISILERFQNEETTIKEEKLMQKCIRHLNWELENRESALIIARYEGGIKR